MGPSGLTQSLLVPTPQPERQPHTGPSELSTSPTRALPAPPDRPPQTGPSELPRRALLSQVLSQSLGEPSGTTLLDSVTHRLPDRDPRHPASTPPRDPRPRRHHDRRGRNRHGKLPSISIGSCNGASPDKAIDSGQPGVVLFLSTTSTASPDLHIYLANLQPQSHLRLPDLQGMTRLCSTLPLCPQLAHMGNKTSLSPTADIHTCILRTRRHFSSAPQWHLPTRGRSGPPWGGMVTQNRAAVDNSPQVDANNDDFSLIEDNLFNWIDSSVGTHKQ